ncbi:hypothetical protein ACROYT_G008873 [Oculina patagonica]
MAAAAAASSACSSVSSLYDVSAEKTNGTRLARLLIDGGTHVLREFLHSIYPPTTLQHVLNNNRPKFQNLKSRRVITGDQWEKLYPSSGDPPDSEAFDITLLHLLLRELCHLTAPPTGWHKMPADSDASLEANVIRIKFFRNELCHRVFTGILMSEFEDKWNKISHSLTLEEEVQHLKVHIQRPIHSEQTSPHELSNCLPDEVPDVFGRSKEILEVINAVQSGIVPIAVITGGPGFGKTTVANKVAHTLAKPEYCRRILCCSLASKSTLEDIATTMILTCGKNHSQPPENPQHWVLNWSKQQPEKVTFVLDNADDVLESGSRDQFVNITGGAGHFASVYPGSFDSDAAEAAIVAGPDTGTQPVVRILRSLKNRSLLEQPSSCRYEIHQLIQAFVKKVSQGRCSQALNQGEKMACAHFISRLADNANMYWSKDKCKESVETFNEDRHNFEHFLQVYVDGKKRKTESRYRRSL